METKTDGLAGMRTKLLEAVRRIVVALFQRETIERHDLCPEVVAKPSREALEKYAALRLRISKLAGEMAEVERTAGGKVGVLALLGMESEPCVRLAVAVLVAKALSDSVAGRVGTVGDLAEFCSGNASPDELLVVRRAFSRNGVLRPFCEFNMGRSIEQCRRLHLTEKALGTVLALPPAEAVEFEVLAERGWRGVE